MSTAIIQRNLSNSPTLRSRESFLNMGWWDDFANNLATDLGPLIALFGEAPTKQYLSETTMPEDIVIFAMAPIGILTAVVSAIRVCGSPSLRAFIGRAQEGEGNAEVELCSFTSRNVGELYNNGGIARVFGTPKFLEIIFYPEALKEDFYLNHFKKASAGIHLPRDYFKNLKKESEWTEKGTRRGNDTVEDGTETQHTKDFALNPNLSLKVGIQERPRLWFLVAACLGVTLQCGVLVWAGFSRYTFHFIQSNSTAEYAVPMTVTGTIVVSFGVGLCALLVDSTTGERRFKRNGNLTNYQSQMYWIQPGNQKIGDQAFDSFAYTKDKSTSEYITSWKKKKPDGMEKNRVEALVWLAVGSSIVGFILQFLGLRACHSSVSVAQLGVMLVMSIVRAGLRTQRLKDEQNLIGKDSDIFKGHELDWLALQLGRDARSQRKWRIAYVGTDYSQVAAFFGDKNRKSLCIGEEYQLVGFRPTDTNHEEAGLNHFPEGWLKDFQSTREGSPPHDAVKTFLYRCRLARITDNWTQTLVPVRETAAALARAIEGTADFIFAAFDIKYDWDEAFAMYWPIKCELLDQTTKPGDGALEVFISLKRHVDWTGSISGNWKVDVPELEAVLGLQLLALDEYQRRKQYAEETQSSREMQSMRTLWQLPDNADFDVQCMEYDMWRESRQPKIRNDEVDPPWSRDKSSLRNEYLPMPLRFGWRNICQKDQNSAKVRVLALPTNLPLPKLCAQDMYSSFFHGNSSYYCGFGNLLRCRRALFEMGHHLTDPKHIRREWPGLCGRRFDVCTSSS
ncbi:hypothetical protein IWX90DRAFT_188502 [Phyllosticta citrichinensis]|uniref:Uncharacterized protein n=1 Tax=Phyllosticta citrichinensis TaxID=1130410 RepID=A0ABR1XWV8_9PEZI